MRKRKKRIAGISALALTLTLALNGCSSREAQSQEAAVRTSQEQSQSLSDEGTEEEPAPGQTEETGAEQKNDQEETGPVQENDRTSGENRLHPVVETVRSSAYAEDGMSLLWQGNTVRLSIRDEGYEALKESLADYSDEKKAAFQREMAVEEEYARENQKAFPEEFLSYSLKNEAKVLRADSGVFSFRMINYSYMGGAHGNSAVTGETFDSQTGQRLELSDVVTDLEAFHGVLIQTLENREDADGYFPGWEDTVRSRVYGETVNGISYELQWALGPEGMEVYFSPYDIGPYAMGTVTAVLPYEESGIIRAAWVHGEGVREQRVWQLAPYEEQSLDVDGDGAEEQVRFEPAEMNDMEQMYTLYAGEQKVEFNGTYGVTTAYVMRNPDGKVFFYGDCSTDNDYHYLVIVDLEELKSRGAETEVRTDSQGMYDDIPMDSQSFWLSTRGNLFSTFPIRKLYQAGADGMPRTQQEEYAVDRWPVTAVQGVPAFGGENFSQPAEIPAGTKLFVTATDEERRVTVEDEEGTAYQLQVDGQDWPHTIEGRDIEELFEGLVFAG